jgi:hypothetical protein
MLFITLLGGCERKQRARERDAIEAEARAKKLAQEAARRAAEPRPEEPPVEMTRVPDSGLPCAVDDVFASKCRRCHTIPPRHGAPFVFLTWDDTRQDRFGQPLYVVIGRAVKSGFMPYKIEANPPVVPLTEDEKKVIIDWVDAGAPKGECDPNTHTEKKAAASKPSAGSKSPKPASSSKADAAPAASN